MLLYLSRIVSRDISTARLSGTTILQDANRDPGRRQAAAETVMNINDGDMSPFSHRVVVGFATGGGSLSTGALRNARRHLNKSLVFIVHQGPGETQPQARFQC